MTGWNVMDYARASFWDYCWGSGGLCALCAQAAFGGWGLVSSVVALTRFGARGALVRSGAVGLSFKKFESALTAPRSSCPKV
jgi:hypothetical protein